MMRWTAGRTTRPRWINNNNNNNIFPSIKLKSASLLRALLIEIMSCCSSMRKSHA